MKITYEQRKPKDESRLYRVRRNKRVVDTVDKPDREIVHFEEDIYASHSYDDKGEYLFTVKGTSVRPKFLCIGGPFDKEKRTTFDPEVRKQYYEYNRGIGGRRKDGPPTMVFVWKGLLG